MSAQQSNTRTRKVYNRYSYEYLKFRELPEEAQEAVKTLGFDWPVWNCVSEPKNTLLGAKGSFATEWKDLPEEKKKAAEVLGYSQETWIPPKINKPFD